MEEEKQVNNNLSNIRFVAVSMAIAVVLGALGAHALKELLDVEKLASFKTGVLYHIIHNLAILGIVAISSLGIRYNPWVIRLMKIGIFTFSGSIYLLSTLEIHGMEFLRFLGPVTPIGGVLLITAWGLLGYSVVKSK